jgi:cell division transport system ATP-binding protein
MAQRTNAEPTTAHRPDMASRELSLPDSMILMRDVSLKYPNGVRALQNVNLRIAKGEFVFIVGETGCGKTSLLKLIYRELLPTSGRVYLGMTDVGKLAASRVPHLRRNLGVIFQDFKLLPDRTVWENVAFALRVIGVSGRQIRRRVPPVLDLVGLLARSDSRPDELSGGEQQRACMARALVNNPTILLADEPTGNLDPGTSWEIVQILSRVSLKGTTVLMASHDLHVVDRLKRRVVAMEKGRIVRDEIKGSYHGVVATQKTARLGVYRVPFDTE